MEAIPLHTRSRHSLGFGTASVEELASRAAALGLPSLALTDIESLAGQIRFHDACVAQGIRPITGVELRSGYARRSSGLVAGRLILLARDEEGYASLNRIVSRRRTTPRPEGDGSPLDSLAQGAGGLFVLTDDVSVLGRLLRMGEIDRADVRLLLTRPLAAEAERAVRHASQATGVLLVADLDLVTLDEVDRALHTLLIAIRERVTVDEVRDASLDAAARHTFDAAALDRFADVPEAVGETHRIAEACTLDLRTRRTIPPRLPELSEDDAISELRRRCEQALAERRSSGGERSQGSGGSAYGGADATGSDYAASAYDDRLERELGTIERLGFADYFLAVAEIVRGAGELGIATAGRGSAAGSLAAHLLGFTRIDPVRADLLFERFLHEQRDAPPDIDLDVASLGRDALNAWVVRRFGRERVAGIASYGSYRARSAIRFGLAALGVARGKIEPVLRRLDTGEATGSEEAALVERTLLESPTGAVRAAASLIARLVGMPSHLAAHPGGIVIADGPLEQLVPLERAPGGRVVTQHDYRAVERAGFLKIDLLGNRFLSEMQETLAALPLPPESSEEGSSSRSGPVVPATPADSAADELTWRTLDNADTVGCFQVESPAMRSVLRRLPIREFADLVAGLAVVRPGAAAGAAKERYVRGARDRDMGSEPLEMLGIDSGAAGFDIRYAGLRERLARTHGVLLYDEDIIRLLASVGGMSFAAADSLRSAILAAGEAPEALRRLGARFVSTAVDSGADERVAERAWQAAARFASYSFAEAHAASYAVLAWQAAWLRTHAPVEFGCALINHHRGIYPLRTTAAAVERWGVALLPPSLNRSELASTVERRAGAAVRVGLRAVKGLTRRTAGDLLEGRPFGDLGEMIERVRPAKRELRALLLSGACDELPPLSPAGYPLVHEVVLKGMEGEVGPDALAGMLDRVARPPSEGGPAEEYRAYQALVRVRNEIRFLDMHLSDHPMRLLRPEAERYGCVLASELASRVGRPLRFAGLLAAARRVPERRGELRYLTFEDESGLIEAVLIPEANARLGDLLTTPGPYLVTGTVRETDGDLHLGVSELAPFHERE